MDKLFLITDYWFPKIGGMERSIEYLIEFLKQKYHIYLITQGSGISAHKNNGWHLVRFSADSSRSYYTDAFQFIRNQTGKKLVHMFGFSFQWPAQQAEFIKQLKNELKIPVILKIPTSGDVSLYLDNEFSGVKDLIDGYITLNQKIWDELLIAKVDQGKIVRIGNSVPTHFYLPKSRKEKLALRKQLGLPEHRFLLCFSGRFILRKRIDILIQAVMAIEPKDRPGLVLVGYSDQTFGDAFEVTPYLNSDIRVLPIQSDMTRIYPAMDMYISASEAEGMSNSILEAMACGLPILANDIPGHRDLVLPSKNGYLFKNDDYKNLSALIYQVQRHLEKNELELFGNYSRKLAEEKFDTSLIARKYVDIYDSLLHNASLKVF